MTVIRRRKKSIEVDTIQWTGDNEAEIKAFTGPSNFRAIPAEARVTTPEITASVYDILHHSWIGMYTGWHVVRGVRGECHPIADDVIAETYEVPVDGGDFFEPGRTYTEPDGSTDWQFRCDTVTTHPATGQRTALGWRHFRGEWETCAYDEDEWEIHQIADAFSVEGEGQ